MAAWRLPSLREGWHDAADRWRSWWAQPRDGWRLARNGLSMGLLLLVCMVAGLMLAVAGPRAAILLVGLLGLLFCLVVPLSWLFGMMLLLVYFGVGQLQYFARIDKAFWFPYLLALLLYGRVLVHRMSMHVPPGPRPPLGPLSWLMLFLVCAVASSVINLVPLLQWFVAGKEYFFLWAVLLCLVWRGVEAERLLRLTPWVVAFLLVQIPVAAYQRFFVATQRVGASTFDAVVGLFGGDPEGGGASGAMAVFVVVVLGFTVEAWRAKRLSSTRALLIAFIALGPVLLAEVKVVFLLIPAMLLVTHGQMLLRFPIRAVIGSALGLVFLFGVIVAYQAQFVDPNARESYSVEQYLRTTYERNTTLSVSATRGEVGRLAALNFWFEREASNFGPKTLIGYGVGSTRVGSLVLGELPRRYQFRVGRSSMAVHLWEVGLVGTGALLAMFGSSIVLAYRTARRLRGTPWAWSLRGCAVGLLMVMLCLPYNTDFVEVSQIQILVMLMMGFVIVVSRLRPEALLAASPSPDPRAVAVHRHQGA